MESKKTRMGFGFGNPPMIKTFISIDRVYFVHEDETIETAEKWLKRIIKETIMEEREDYHEANIRAYMKDFGVTREQAEKELEVVRTKIEEE